VDCPSCGRANASDRVECSHCEELLVDVFESRGERTDPIMAIGKDLSVEDDVGNDSGDGFTRFPTDVQYSGDLPRLFRFGNRYQVLEKLGEGGMGRVYKALDLELDRAVALKTIRAEKGRGPEVLKRFKQELVLARKITHKNVVRIYDLGEAEGGVKFFTMELVEGKSLRDLLNEKKTTPTKEAISFMKQMLSGLAEAHSQGVVHRDLKPQNIMVDESGVLRIMDFGIARTADTATLTSSGEMVGTPDYISPEQVKGETANAQSDLYAIGIILYELLTGVVPFKGDTAIAKVVARLQVKPAPPRALNPQIPAYLERIILKLMEVDPDLRYKTADEVLQDLEREQVDSSLFLKTRKAILRQRGWIAAVLFGSLGLGVWLIARKSRVEGQADVPVTTIAILPFHNTTANPELAWMETGLPEMLITDISQSNTLRPLLEDRVRRILDDLGKSGQTTFEEETLEVFFDMAGADYILHGRFLESEGRLRIDLTLKERATGVGTPMKLDGKASEVFALVDLVTERVSTELDLDSLFDRNRPVSDVATSSLDSFRAYQRGIGDLQNGRNQAATTALKEAVTLDPTFAMAHARLAEAYWNLGDSASAKASVETANALAIEHPLPLSARFQIHAIAARINDDPDTAIEAYRRLAGFYPSDPDVMLGLATALESKGEMNEALKAYRAVADANPTYGAALLGLGRMLVTVDSPSEAIPFLERALASGEFTTDQESLGMLHSILGMAYKNSEDYLKAIEHFEISLIARRAVGDRRGIIATLVNMAAARRRRTEFEDAADLLTRAVKEAAEFRIPSMESAALQNLGTLALETDRLDDALESYRASLDIELRLKQDNEIAYRLNSMADVYRRKGFYVESLICLEQAKKRLEGVDEPSERAFNLRILADVQRARGQLEDAVQAILTAIPIYQLREEFDELAWARSALADIYSVQGRFGEALRVVEQGLQDFSSGGTNLATMNLSYADFLINVGEYEGAQQKLNTALELATDSKFEEQPQFTYLWGRIKSANQDNTASKYLSSATDQASRRGDLLLSGRASIALAEVLIAEGKVQDGRQLLSRTLESARKIGNRDVQAYAAVVLAETELSAGRLAESEALSFEAKELANDFQGKPILRRIQENLLGVARIRGDSDAVDGINREVVALDNWLQEQVPRQHADWYARSRIAAPIPLTKAPIVPMPKKKEGVAEKPPLQ
jgi:eukaryotic-like serine/threonine-protein kinase